MHNILVTDDEEKIRLNLQEILSLKGFVTREASSGEEAVRIFTSERPDAVLLDMRMPGIDGLETLRRLRQIDASVPVIMVTAHSDVPSAVNAIKQGAYDFLPKPPDFDHLIITLNRAIEKAALERRVRELDATLHTSLESTLGSSPAMRQVVDQLPRVSASDFSVLIEGETGTGKTYLAGVIHSLSKRAGRPFVKVSIGSLQETIVESELFGYERGAFTGAERSRKGYFEAADGGTLFIDDLDNIGASVQGKLLGVLEDKRVFRVGSTVAAPVDIRIISATNADLLKLVSEGKFREDLFFRLSEVTIKAPALRERGEDIGYFAGKFLREACGELDVRELELTEECAGVLKGWPWPGNLRQLKNVMKRAALEGGPLTEGALQKLLGSSGTRETPATGGKPTLLSMKDAERAAILRALEHTGGQRLKAAAVLGIDYKTLVRKISEFGID